MRRKAFILAEILTGLALQAGFALTLCGAFYMLVSFSSSMSQTLSSYDQGQLVINYIENRIRNAGIGLWECNTPEKVAEAFGINGAYMKALNDKNIHLPVAITASTDKFKGLSFDGSIYEGNILTLMYAHKDRVNPDKMVITNTTDGTTHIDTTISKASSDKFQFIRNIINSSTQAEASNFNLSDSAYNDSMRNNLKNWTVMETSGVPLIISDYSSTALSFKLNNISGKDVIVHPLSELLNVELQRMYVKADGNGSNFVFQNADDNLSIDSGFTQAYYHAKDILEIYMKLDVSNNKGKNPAPLFDLKVLLSAGQAPVSGDETLTECPDNWPKAFWKDEFKNYNVHVMEAQWRLYNLTGWTFTKY